MRRAGVNPVQGYLLGKPVPVAQLDFTSAASPADMVA
jgi:EAL domain-containing protein (putative c-di-GMP-specific phosphodiesterase class I)